MQLSCTHKKIDTVLKEPSTDVEKIEIILERGAFHNDKFILKDSLISFFPSKDGFSSENRAYSEKSSQIISLTVAFSN